MAPTTHLDPIQAGQQITRDNVHWGATLGQAAGPITFGFRLSAPTYNFTTEQTSFTKVNISEMTAIESVVRLWSNVANITFQEVNKGGYTDSAVMLFANFDLPGSGGAAHGSQPGNTQPSSESGDVWFNVNGGAFQTVLPNSYAFTGTLHEIGHTLGFLHPGDYNFNPLDPTDTITYANSAAYIEDSRQYTVMSYFEASETGANHVFNRQTVYASTPLLDDITAAQRLYGANTSFATGNNVYGFNNNADPAYAITSGNQQVVYCIWDGGGNDTLDLSGYTTNQKIDLRPGAFSDAGALTKNISIALGTIIENAIGGSGDDIIIGNDADNSLIGNGGNDTFTGGKGNDRIDGGVGVWRDGADYTVNGMNHVFYDSANQHFYRVVTLAKTATWNEAATLASGLTVGSTKGHLVSISDANENAYVQQMITAAGFDQAQTEAYIGLQKVSGTWKWITGEDAAFTQWGNNQPATDAWVSVGMMFGGRWFGLDNQFNNYQNSPAQVAVVEFDTTAPIPYAGTDVNVAVYSGNRADYTITSNGGKLTVADTIPNRDGTDTLINIQQLKFADTTVSTDTIGPTPKSNALETTSNHTFHVDSDQVIISSGSGNTLVIDTVHNIAFNGTYSGDIIDLSPVGSSTSFTMKRAGGFIELTANGESIDIPVATLSIAGMTLKFTDGTVSASFDSVNGLKVNGIILNANPVSIKGGASTGLSSVVDLASSEGGSIPHSDTYALNSTDLVGWHFTG